MAVTEISIQAIINKFSAKTAELVQQLVMMEIQRDTLAQKVQELEAELGKLKPGDDTAKEKKDDKKKN